MRRTSSKVRAASSRTRATPFSVDAATSKREGPPSLFGDAGLDWGRFVVAMDKGKRMTLGWVDAHIMAGSCARHGKTFPEMRITLMNADEHGSGANIRRLG